MLNRLQFNTLWTLGQDKQQSGKMNKPVGTKV